MKTPRIGPLFLQSTQKSKKPLQAVQVPVEISEEGEVSGSALGVTRHLGQKITTRYDFEISVHDPAIVRGRYVRLAARWWAMHVR
jgi:hypothetical protein